MLGNVEMRHGLVHLHQSQPVKRAVERASFAVGRDDRRRMAADCRRSNDVAFVTEAGERVRPPERGDERRRRRRADDDGAVGSGLAHPGYVDAQQATQRARDLGGYHVARGRPLRRDDRGGRLPVGRALIQVDQPRISEPQVVAGLGTQAHRKAHTRGDECGAHGEQASRATRHLEKQRSSDAIAADLRNSGREIEVITDRRSG